MCEFSAGTFYKTAGSDMPLTCGRAVIHIECVAGMEAFNLTRHASFFSQRGSKSSDTCMSQRAPNPAVGNLFICSLRAKRVPERAWENLVWRHPGGYAGQPRFVAQPTRDAMPHVEYSPRFPKTYFSSALFVPGTKTGSNERMDGIEIELPVHRCASGRQHHSRTH